MRPLACTIANILRPSELDRTILHKLTPEAERLMERHLSVAQEWFPHEYIPYRLGRDFDTEPWTPDQPRLTGVAQTAFEVNLLTEDNLPSSPPPPPQISTKREGVTRYSLKPPP